MPIAKNGVEYERAQSPGVSQKLRRTVQFAFLAINAWVATEFLLWVMRLESRITSPVVDRPAGVEGWLPIAGLMNAKFFFATGTVPPVHPAAMFLFFVFAGLSMVVHKVFCGWICPVGTISEYLWKLGRETFGRNFTLPKWLDLPLRSLKYLLFAFFLNAVITMTAASIFDFLYSPYGVIADVKLLNFFRYIGVTGAAVIGVLVIGSVLVRNFWCRYLCPYGALMGIAALLSPVKIRREVSSCIDCAKCAHACPSGLKVDKLITIRTAECIGCMECVAACPVEGALHMSLAGTKRAIGPRAIAAGIAAAFLLVVAGAKVTNHWTGEIPAAMYERLVPQSMDLDHPR